MRLRKRTGDLAEEDPISVGNMLVRSRILTRAQLNVALDYQRTKAPHMRLGEVCIHFGFVTRERLDLVLERQQILRMPEPERSMFVSNVTCKASMQARHLSDRLDQFTADTLAILAKRPA